MPTSGLNSFSDKLEYGIYSIVSRRKYTKKLGEVVLEHRLPKPLRYFYVLARFAFFRNPGSDASQLQLPSVHHNPSCDGCTRDAEENRMRKKVWLEETLPRKD